MWRWGTSPSHANASYCRTNIRSKILKKARARVIILGAIFAGLSGLCFLYGPAMKSRELEAMSGVIKGPEVDLEKPFIVDFGKNFGHFSINSLQEGIKLSQLIVIEINETTDYEYPIKIKYKDGKIYISADIKNSDGDTIAHITDNEWDVNEDNMIAHDRNYNDYALEVINIDRLPVLQVILKEQNTIYIGGLFHIPDGYVIATPKGWIINPSEEWIDELKQSRIFKYPSERYLHQMMEDI